VVDFCCCVMHLHHYRCREKGKEKETVKKHRNLWQKKHTRCCVLGSHSLARLLYQERLGRKGKRENKLMPKRRNKT
jgi:hypothetical protein